MDVEILAYLAAALMVVLAWLAYRYWHRTPTYARRMRESYSDQAMRPLLAPAPRDDALEDEGAVEDKVHPDESAANLPLIDRPTDISDGTADATEETLSESIGVEDLLPADSIEDASSPETEQVDVEQPMGMVQDQVPARTAPPEVSSAGIVPDTKETTPANLTIDESQFTDVEASAQEGVVPTINPAPESLPAEDGDREAAPSGDPELSPDAPVEDSTQPEAETTGDPDLDPVHTEENTTRLGVETAEEPSAEILPEPAAATLRMDDGEIPEEIPMKPEYRLIEELEPRETSSRAINETGSIAALLKELDEKLAALPSGIELINLPILERRRIADRREELLSDRELLLDQRKRGAHRRRRPRTKR
ncbi:MAG: hypothetical protein ACXWH0_04600 [Acidimicrobiia bacterium]